MTDIIERAEAALKWTRTSATNRTLAKLVPELVADLKAERAERKRLIAEHAEEVERLVRMSW